VAVGELLLLLTLLSFDRDVLLLLSELCASMAA